jgi:hypothetical protein
MNESKRSDEVLAKLSDDLFGVAELETDHTSTKEDCIPCQQLLERIDADLLEYDKAMAEARAKRLKAIAIAIVLLVVGGIVVWRLFF